MAKLSMRETHDAAGKPAGWVVQTLPEDFRDGDLWPGPQTGDFYGTKEECQAELNRRMGGSGEEGE